MNRDAGAVLVGFLNTEHLPDGIDALAGSTPQDWLADGLTDGGRALGAPAPHHSAGPDLRQLRALRAGLRVLTRPTRPTAAQQVELERAALALQAVPMVMRLPADHREQPRLIAVEADTGSVGLAAVAQAYLRATADETFGRVKTCGLADCQWAFLDLSRNRSRRWCAMQECGNRAKNRTYRARRAHTA